MARKKKGGKSASRKKRRASGKKGAKKGSKGPKTRKAAAKGSKSGKPKGRAAGTAPADEATRPRSAPVEETSSRARAAEEQAREPPRGAPDHHVDDVDDAAAAPVSDADEGRDEVGDEPELVHLDEEEGADEAVERLIADTVATAKPDPDTTKESVPVIDLDGEADEGTATTDVPEPDASAEGARPAPDADAAGEATRPDALGAHTLPARAEGDADEVESAPAVAPEPVSSPEARARLLAEALAHAEHQDARYRIPFSATPTAARWKALIALVLLGVAAAVAVVPPTWARPDPPAALGSAARARNLRVALLLQAEQVEAFRIRTQRLPSTLDEVSRAMPGVRYVRSGSRSYQLIAYERTGNAIVYDSADPTPAFDALATGWRPLDVEP